jgi:hypothetical protein
MSRYIPEHPKKGSTEAYEWAERMRQARQKKARTKAAVREAGQLTEMQFFGPGGSLEVKRRTKRNPGVRYHEEAAQVAGRYRKDAASNTERVMYAGMEIAHKDSAKAAQALGMNPPVGLSKSKWLVTRLKDLKTQVVSYQDSIPFYGKPGYYVEALYEKKANKRIKKNPIAVYNPPAPKVVGTIYNKAIEIRAKKTGSDLAGKYKHVFGNNVKILGLDNGDVVIHHTRGKRLWISRKDYERSGKSHE